MRGAVIFAFVFALLILIVSGACASVDLEVSLVDILDDGSANFSTSFVTQTYSGASNGLDGFDYFSSSYFLPDENSELYATVDGKKLAIDSWDDSSSSRVINLTYSNSPQAAGNLYLSWSYSSGITSATLYDYGGDSSYGDEVSHVDMSSSSSYSVADSSGVRYFQIVLSPITSFVQDVVSGITGSGGGGGGSVDIGIGELVAPVFGEYVLGASVGGSYTFTYSGNRHRVIIVNVSAGEVLVRVQSTPKERLMRTGDIEEFDLNDDGREDIYVKVISVAGSNVRYEFGPIELRKKIEIIPESITINAISGEEDVRKIRIKNIAGERLRLNVQLDGVYEIVKMPSIVELNAGEEKEIEIKFKSDDKAILGGKIKFVANKQVFGEIPVLVNVKSENFLFDSLLSISPRTKSIRAGKEIKAQIDLQQVGQEGKVDVVATYTIKDFEGRVYYSASETFYVFGSKSLTKNFPTNNMPPGKYILGLELVYPGAFATSTAQFEVRNSLGVSAQFLIILTILILIAGLIVAGVWASKKRHYKNNKV